MRPEATAPAMAPRKKGVMTDEAAKAAPRPRRAGTPWNCLRNTKAEPRRMMPMATAVSGR